MRGVALLIGITLAGCFDSSSDGFAVCDKACSCQTGLPAQQDECFDGCMEDIPAGLELGAECIECFEAASCIELESCLPACGVDDDPPVEGR